MGGECRTAVVCLSIVDTPDLDCICRIFCFEYDVPEAPKFPQRGDLYRQFVTFDLCDYDLLVCDLLEHCASEVSVLLLSGDAECNFDGKGFHDGGNSGVEPC